MLKYLDKRYLNIIGHQSLMRFVNNFPHFKRAIEQYTLHDHQRKLIDGTMPIVPGLNFMPWDVFSFIDDSIDCISTPFSSPCGNYEGPAQGQLRQRTAGVLFRMSQRPSQKRTKRSLCQMACRCCLVLCPLNVPMQACLL
jgi:hypothetical protein